MKEIDYVERYAKELRTNPALFQQQKRFLESQYQISRSLFQNFQGDDFKKKAREYLKGRGLI